MSVQLTHLDITGQVISSVVLLSSSIVPLAPHHLITGQNLLLTVVPLYHALS